MNKKHRDAEKIRGLQNQNTKLHEICTRQREAIQQLLGQNRELNFAVDSILAAIAVKYGEQRMEDGVVLGYRLSFPAADFAKALKRYEVHSNKEQAEYVIAVVARNTPEHGAGKPADPGAEITIEEAANV